MKVTLSFDVWREQPFFLRRKAEPPVPLPNYARLRATVPSRAHSIRDALIALIDSAAERVFVCSFLLGGDGMRDALRRAAQRLHGHVYVITALDAKALERSLGREPSRLNADNLEREIKSFEALTRHGIYVRGAENCHAKFCIVDDRAALVGSANFDRNGLGEADGIACGELGLVIEGPERVAPIVRLFRHLWKCGCQREAPPLREGYRLSGVSPAKDQPLDAPEGAEAVVWTGFRSTTILAGVQQVIASAQHTLTLGSYSFTAMRANPALILDPLAEARRRGVQIELLMRDRSRDLTEIGALLDLGIEVRANRENHAKYAIADGEHGLLFSANFDGIHGLTDGVETGVRLRPEEAREVAQWHAQMWREAPTQAVCWTSPEALSQALPEVRCEHPAFLGRALSLRGEPGDLVRCAAILRGPCVVVSDGDEHAPRSIQFVGFDDAVLLQRNGRDVRVIGADREDASYCALPKCIAMAPRRSKQTWLPLGMEVNLP
jgi:phosphatidylserine/phosphatidylglycerophosphate/cardiolipin synthase-like enzyme